MESLYGKQLQGFAKLLNSAQFITEPTLLFYTFGVLLLPNFSSRVEGQ